MEMDILNADNDRMGEEAVTLLPDRESRSELVENNRNVYPIKSGTLTLYGKSPNRLYF